MWMKVSRGDSSLAFDFVASAEDIYVYNSNYTD